MWEIIELVEKRLLSQQQKTGVNIEKTKSAGKGQKQPYPGSQNEECSGEIQGQVHRDRGKEGGKCRQQGGDQRTEKKKK